MLAQEGVAVDFHPVVSMPELTGTGWTGDVGFVHEFIARKLVAPLDSYEYYLAGRPAADDRGRRAAAHDRRQGPGDTNTLRSLLLKRRVPIFFGETTMALHKVCKVGDVPEARADIWLARAVARSPAQSKANMPCEARPSGMACTRSASL
jgi:NAD(P)H-flavin reductase